MTKSSILTDIKLKYGVTTKGAETILNIFDKLKLSTIEQAYEVFVYDNGVAKTTKPVEGEVLIERPKKNKKGGIQLEELAEMKSILITLYQNGESFKNADLDGLREELGLSARQTPSRLKKLAEEGFLLDLGGSPKSYKLK